VFAQIALSLTIAQEKIKKGHFALKINLPVLRKQKMLASAEAALFTRRII
jgi:hypothetical protein